VKYAGIDIEINTTAAALVVYSMTWYLNSRISGTPDAALKVKDCDAVILKIPPHGVISILSLCGTVPEDPFPM
jgi:hypothetical protein